MSKEAVTIRLQAWRSTNELHYCRRFVRDYWNSLLLLNRSYRSTQETTLQESLLAIKARIDPDSVTMLNVTRRRLLEGTLRALKRSNFNEAARISVKFGDDLGCSEGAVDAGGPTREFLRLAVSDVMQSEIFCGEEVARCLTKSGKGKMEL